MDKPHEPNRLESAAIWIGKSIWKSRRWLSGGVTFILAVIGVVPIVEEWIVGAPRAIIYVRYDPFNVYNPGEVTGPTLNPVAAVDGATAKSLLPNPPIIIEDDQGHRVDGPVWDMQVTV